MNKYHLELIMQGNNLNEEEIRNKLNTLVEEYILLGDEDLLKLSLNCDKPWDILSLCDSIAEIYDIVIENLLRQGNGLKG